MALDTFAKRHDKSIKPDPADPKYPPKSERQRRADEVRFGRPPSRAAQETEAKLPANGNEPNSGTLRSERPASILKPNHDMFDTDASSIGDSTMARKGPEVREDAQAAFSKGGAQPEDCSSDDQLRLKGFQDGEEAAGIQNATRLLQHRAANIGTTGLNWDLNWDMVRPSYPPTSPSDTDYHQPQALRQGTQAFKDGEQDWKPYSAPPRADASQEPPKNYLPRAPNRSTRNTGNLEPPTQVEPSSSRTFVGRDGSSPLLAAAAPAQTISQRDAPQGNDEPERSPGPDVTTTLKRVHESEHPMDELKAMTFADLKSEPFERGPQETDIAIPEKIRAGSLQTQLEWLRALPPPPDEDLQSNQQYRFFARLSLDQHEECGGLILAQFQEMVGRMQRLRKDKRTAALQFEGEIERRVNALQKQKDDLDRDLATLKTKGQDVVKKRG